jgi:hypothetical protein
LYKADSSRLSEIYFEGDAFPYTKGIEISGASGLVINNLLQWYASGTEVGYSAPVGSRFLSLAGCSSVIVNGLHIEHCPHLIMINLASCVGVNISGIHDRFSRWNGITMSSGCKGIHIEGWDSDSDIRDSATDITTTSTNVEDVTFSGCRFISFTDDTPRDININSLGLSSVRETAKYKDVEAIYTASYTAKGNSTNVLGSPSSNSTITLPSISNNKGKEITFYNRNTTSFIWQFNTPVKDLHGQDLLVIKPNSVLTIELASTTNSGWRVKTEYVDPNYEVVSGTDVDFTIPRTNYEYIVPTLTANRVITLPSSTLNKGKIVSILNGNNTAFTLSVSGSILELGGSVSTIGNQTSVVLTSDGANWRVLNKTQFGVFSAPSASFSGNIDVVGQANLGQAVISGTANISGSATFGSTANITGAVNNGSTVNTTGLTTLSGSLNQLSGSVHNMYFTTDLTNYERITQAWTGNIFDIYSTSGGAGTARTLRIGVAASTGGAISRYMAVNPAGQGFSFGGPMNTSFGFLNFIPTANASTGVNNIIDVAPTITQTSTAGFTAFRVSPFVSTSGSGVKNLIDIGTNSAGSGGGTHTSYFKIDNTGLLTLGNNAIPDGDNTRSLGSTTARFAVVYAINVSKGNAGNSFNLAVTNTSDIYMRVQPTTNNFVMQSAGSAPTENNYKLTIDGTGASAGSLLVTNGISTFGGNILANANGTLDIGSTSNKFNNIYVNNVRGNGTLRITAGTGNSIIFSQISDATTVGQFFATTGNFALQAPAALPTDDLVNRLQVAGSVKATQYRLSALNTAPSSATDTGTLGEIRVDANYIYVCTATNTWVRSALTTW